MHADLKARTLIVEDESLFREVLTRLCTHDLKLSVVAATGSGNTAEEMIARTHPNLVILDLALGDSDGLSVVAKAMTAGATMKILVVSCHVNEHTVWKAQTLGVSGFVDKNESTLSQLRTAIRSVASGGTYFSESFSLRRSAIAKNPRSIEHVLTPREKEILSLIAAGAGDDDIAVRLNISAMTAQTHRRNISHKLGTIGTPGIMSLAIRHGYLL